MTRYPFITKILGIIFLAATGQGLCAQPQASREQQEVVVAATETIKTNEMTIESRSERIRMLKSQLETTQKALGLAMENDSLNEDVRVDLQNEVKFLTDELATAKTDYKKEKWKKIGWKIFAIAETGLIVYLLL